MFLLPHGMMTGQTQQRKKRRKRKKVMKKKKMKKRSQKKMEMEAMTLDLMEMVPAVVVDLQVVMMSCGSRKLNQ